MLNIKKQARNERKQEMRSAEEKRKIKESTSSTVDLGGPELVCFSLVVFFSSGIDGIELISELLFL